MAYVEVVVPDESFSPFRSMKAIGDRISGRFVGVKTVTKNFPGQPPKAVSSYIFRGYKLDGSKQVEDFEVNPGHDLERRLVAANLTRGLPVIMELTGFKDVGKASPMALHKVQVDRDAVNAAPPPPPTPAPIDDDEDIPF